MYHYNDTKELILGENRARCAFLESSYSPNIRCARYEKDGRRAVGLNRHRALQNCAARPGERFHNSTNGLIK